MGPIFKILSFTKQYTRWYIFMGFFVVTTSLLSLVNPLLSKQIVDLIVKKIGGEYVFTDLFFYILAAMIFADISATFLTAFGQWIGDLLSVKLQTFLSQKFYEHVLSLHIGYFDNEITGKIVNKMYRGITSITGFIQNMLNNFLPFFLTAFVTVILLAKYSLIISLLLAVLFPIYIVISHKSSKDWIKYENEKNSLNDQSQGRVFESLTGIRVVKSFSAEIAELTSFIKNRKSIENLAKIQTKKWHLYDFARRFALNIILFGIYTYIVYKTFAGLFTLGEMTLLLALVQQARFPLFAMSFILGQIQEASSGSADYFKILETKSEIKDKTNAKTLIIDNPKKEFIKFSQVDFTYDQGKHVLKNISFTVKHGERIALVGESGQGKSTIVNLLLRYYEPQKGVISINNQDISKVTQDSLHAQFAVVFQESLLFSGTIYENIKYPKPDATEKEIIDAARGANAHSFIMEFPDQYKSAIGERGVKLSGGQKQRIAIARAIVKQAPIIILDEATSSLDSKAELEVQKGLNELLKNKTSIIIAHRLSTIASADHLLVIENGKISQYGTHAELLKDTNGLYSQLVTLQETLLKAPSEERRKKLESFDIVS